MRKKLCNTSRNNLLLDDAEPDIKKFGDTYRYATPFAAHSGETLGRPASLLTDETFGIARQVTLPPVVVLYNAFLILIENQQL